MPEEKIERIEGVSKSLEKTSARTRVEPNAEQFDAIMAEQTDAKAVQKIEPSIEAVSKPSPMDEVRNLQNKVDAMSKASPEEVRVQATELIAEIDSIHKKYSNIAGLDVKPSYQVLLKNRLSHIDDALKVALSTAGVEHTSPPVVKTVNPVEKFLGYLSHGQYQLEHLEGSIQNIHDKGFDLSPGDMLVIQVKMHQVQQELEFFTNLLNKALESTKTLMNVQV